MGLFGKKSEGGLMDVIRCDEQEYLVWKWRPSGEAVFQYKQKDGTIQEYIWEKKKLALGG